MLHRLLIIYNTWWPEKINGPRPVRGHCRDHNFLNRRLFNNGIVIQRDPWSIRVVSVEPCGPCTEPNRGRKIWNFVYCTSIILPNVPSTRASCRPRLRRRLSGQNVVDHCVRLPRIDDPVDVPLDFLRPGRRRSDIIIITTIIIVRLKLVIVPLHRRHPTLPFCKRCPRLREYVIPRSAVALALIGRRLLPCYHLLPHRIVIVVARTTPATTIGS